MSMWGYIHTSGTADLKLDAWTPPKGYQRKDFFLNRVHKVFDEHAPIIHGSEQNAKVYLNALPPTLFSGFYTDRKSGEIKSISYYTDFIFVINGYLRDTDLNRVKKEWSVMKDWLLNNKYFDIDFMTEPVFKGSMHESDDYE